MGKIISFLKSLPEKYSWSGEYNQQEEYLQPEGQKEDLEKELSFIEEKLRIAEHFNRSIEYRVRLQECQKKLQERKSELDKREEAIKIKEEAATERIKAAENSANARIRLASENLNKYSKAIHESEFRCIDYMKRIDKKEIQIFEDIRNNVLKLQEYASSATASENGFSFEEEFAEILRGNGFSNVTVTQKSQDFGADILAEKDDVRYVVQCKLYTSAVGIEAVQQICSAKIYYGSHVAAVATNSVFTRAAKILAEETGVLLWDCEAVDRMRKNAFNQAKIDELVETGRIFNAP